ncbi:TonB-dependent receptor [Pedobacter psychrodurus]|uniref:TonB-dependent receptor n=1 Tax=Pedobacter psychrodurus TaxID=2530456 RepID=UPI002931C167|nr:TonB-dependent receptor [Pedobacter psychrodurus]
MKFNRIFWRSGVSKNRIMLVMKLTVIFLITAFLPVKAAVNAQMLTIQENNISLGKLFTEIHKQTGYSFVYTEEMLAESKNINVKFKNTPLKKVLAFVFSNQPLTYVIKDEVIVVKRKNEPIKTLAIPPADVKGKILDEKGIGMPGVTIKIKNTSTIATSGNNGEFVLKNVPENAILIISYVGYATQEIKADAQAEMTIKLVLKLDELSEILVVGYGTTKREDLTGSVATIGKKELKNVPITRVDQMLQGKAAGVQVTSISGAPGSGSSIRIRGGNSITAGNEPLYVIDGLIGGGDINLINPEDIESMVILKDASSTAIYGARGANGVILITTKKGTVGQDNINFDAYTGWQKIPKLIPMLNASQFAQLANESAVDDGQPAPYSDPQSLGEGTNWQKEISRVAPMQNITLSASGGKSDYNYFLSGNYNRQDGVIINSGFKRYQFRSNLNKSIKENIKIGAILNVGRAETNNNTVSLGGLDYYQSALAFAPTATIYNADGSFNSKRPYDTNVYDNPVAQGTLPTNKTTSTNVIGNLFAEWEMIKDLKFKSTFGSELNFNKRNIYNPGALPSRANAKSGGAADVATENSVMWLSENTLSYTKDITNDHHIDAVIGTSYQTGNTERLRANADLYATDAFLYHNLGATDQKKFNIRSQYENTFGDDEYTIISYLSRLNYSYRSKYLLTLTARIDGSSRFAENHKNAFFPAAAVAWKASDEEFVKNLHVFDNLKFRASFGYNGNQAIGIYSSLPSLKTQSGFLIGDAKILGYTSENLPNPDLKWETTRQFDLGLEFGILKNRITVEIDYYSKRTKDLLLSEQLPTHTGYSSKISNIGSVSNKGLEVLINTRNIISKDFTWETSFNISGNRNKVIDLGGVTGFDLAGTGFGGYSTISRLVVGQPVGTFWGATYMGTQKTTAVPAGSVNPRATPRLGDPLYKDFDGDNKFTPADFGIIGDANPKFYGGLGNTFTYKNLSLNVFLQGSFGNDVMNISDAFYNTGSPLTNQFASNADRWTPNNPNSDIPRVNSRDYITSTRWVYDGSFLRLKTLSLSYALNGKDIGVNWIKRLNVFATGTNLFLMTKYPYYEPETNSYGTDTVLRGFDSTNYPQNRTLALGFNLTL